MSKTNPLVKKGIPTFKKPEAEKHEQIVHPVIEKEIPVTSTSVNPDAGTVNLNQFFNKPEKIEKKQVSIYLDTDVIEAMDKWIETLPQKEKKGAKSELVNNFLKQVFDIRQ